MGPVIWNLWSPPLSIAATVVQEKEEVVQQLGKPLAVIKGKTCISYDLAIPRLGINPREMHAHLYRYTEQNAHGSIVNSSQDLEITQMFISNSINKIWPSHPVEYYTARKMNTL